MVQLLHHPEELEGEISSSPLVPSLEGKCRVGEAMGGLLFLFVSIPDASGGAPTEASESLISVMPGIIYQKTLSRSQTILPRFFQDLISLSPRFFSPPLLHTAAHFFFPYTARE